IISKFNISTNIYSDSIVDLKPLVNPDWAGGTIEGGGLGMGSTFISNGLLYIAVVQRTTPFTTGSVKTPIRFEILVLDADTYTLVNRLIGSNIGSNENIGLMVMPNFNCYCRENASSNSK